MTYEEMLAHQVSVTLNVILKSTDDKSFQAQMLDDAADMLKLYAAEIRGRSDV